MPSVLMLTSFLLREEGGRGVIRAFMACYKYLLLAECEIRTAIYGLSFFLPFMAQVRSVQAMKTRKGKTRIHNLPYGPSKRG